MAVIAEAAIAGATGAKPDDAVNGTATSALSMANMLRPKNQRWNQRFFKTPDQPNTRHARLRETITLQPLQTSEFVPIQTPGYPEY